LLRLLGKDVDAIKLYSLIHQQNTVFKLTKLSDIRTAKVYNNMGLSFMNKGDMKLAQSYFKKAKQALPPRESYTETRLQIVANIARTLMEMEAYSHAVTLLKSNLKSC